MYILFYELHLYIFLVFDYRDAFTVLEKKCSGEPYENMSDAEGEPIQKFKTAVQNKRLAMETAWKKLKGDAKSDIKQMLHINNICVLLRQPTENFFVYYISHRFTIACQTSNERGRRMYFGEERKAYRQSSRT
jgi:hypothetical protein